MNTLEIILNIVSAILIELSFNFLGSHLYNVFKSKEIKDEENAKKSKTIKMGSLLNYLFVLAMLCNLVGIIIIAFPKLIKEYLGFNYIASIIIWWIPLIFDNIVLYFASIKVNYNNQEIIIKRPLCKQKRYKFSEIISFTKTGNLIVKTTHGRFILFKALAGTESLRTLLIEKEMNNLLNLYY